MANLTSKELTAVEDQLVSEKNLIAKYRAYAAVTQDQDLKGKLENIANRHQTHFDRLYALLG